MNYRESPLYWSFPTGSWFRTQVRISAFFPVLALILCIRVDDLKLGLIFSVILLASTLVHEFAHVHIARMAGGRTDDILVWPLGGLTQPQGLGDSKSLTLTAIAGPLVNAVLCGITLPAVLHSPFAGEALHPFHLPTVPFGDELAQSLLVLTFAANWVLLLANLLPIHPLDMGRIVQIIMTNRWDKETAAEFYVRISMAISVLVIVAGLIADAGWLITMGAVLLVMNLQRSHQMRVADAYDDSFLGYDFSQGYTSLERSEDVHVEPQPSIWQRWRERKKTERQLREAREEAQMQQELDALLEKVHSQGFDALTDAERRQLNQVSARLRNKERKNT